MIGTQETERVGLFTRFWPVQERAEACIPVRPRAKGFVYRAWMDGYEARTGKRCTYTCAANHFNVHRTTIMRNIRKVGLA